MVRKRDWKALFLEPAARLRNRIRRPKTWRSPMSHGAECSEPPARRADVAVPAAPADGMAMSVEDGRTPSDPESSGPVPSSRRGRHLFASILFAGLCSASFAPPASAQVLVWDIPHTAQTIAHYIARLTEISQKYQQIYNQYQQIANEYHQIINQLQMLKKLDVHWARNIVGTMARMEILLQRAGLPTHANPAIETIHREIYPGWEVPLDWWRDEERAVTASLDTLRENLKAQYEAHRTQVDHIRTLMEIKQQVRSIEGTEEALEAIAGITAFQAEVSTLAEVARATSADAATAYYSYQINRQARQERAVQEILERSDLTPPELVPGSGYGALPSWWH
jgi:P-type conjugative transfer protein TrbJ